jgi:hypothetical protein
MLALVAALLLQGGKGSALGLQERAYSGQGGQHLGIGSGRFGAGGGDGRRLAWPPGSRAGATAAGSLA